MKQLKPYWTLHTIEGKPTEQPVKLHLSLVDAQAVAALDRLGAPPGYRVQFFPQGEEAEVERLLLASDVHKTELRLLMDAEISRIEKSITRIQQVQKKQDAEETP